MTNEDTYGGSASAQDDVTTAKNNVRQAADDLRAAAEAKAQDLRNAASAKADELRGKAEEYYGQAKASAGEYYDQAKVRAEEYYGDAKNRARTLQEEGEVYVRENPLKAVLVAVGAGFLLGALFRR